MLGFPHGSPAKGGLPTSRRHLRLRGFDALLGLFGALKEHVPQHQGQLPDEDVAHPVGHLASCFVLFKRVPLVRRW